MILSLNVKLRIIESQQLSNFEVTLIHPAKQLMPADHKPY